MLLPDFSKNKNPTRFSHRFYVFHIKNTTDSYYISHLVVKVRRGRSQDAAVSFEHVALDVDGEVTQLAVLSLTVQAVQHGGLSAGEAHLHLRARCVTGS